MKLKRYSIFLLCAGVLFSVFGFAPMVSLYNYTSQNGAIGIIGGADSPTAEFLTWRLMRGLPFCGISFGVTLVVSALFCLIFAKTVINTCKIKTTLLSLGISFVGAMGLVCALMWYTIVAFGEMSRHPISYPVSVLLGVISLFAFIILIVLYLGERGKDWSVKGFLIDILTSIIYLPTFFFVLLYCYQLIG